MLYISFSKIDMLYICVHLYMLCILEIYNQYIYHMLYLHSHYRKQYAKNVALNYVSAH